jgi:hypothetical protein
MGIAKGAQKVKEQGWGHFSKQFYLWLSFFEKSSQNLIEN